MSPVKRRSFLAAGGALAAGVVIGGASMSRVGSSAEPVPPGPAEGRIDFATWRARRSAAFFIGHRGAGDVAPEHTLPSYQAALDWGAEVIEISVVRSADDQVYCLHDLTLDRTTTGSGAVAAQRSEVLRDVRVNVPRLGPRWAGPNMPSLPLLRDVLAVVGGRAVLCIEAKDDKAYPSMIEAITDAGLRDTVMIKLPGSAAGRLEEARLAGYPIFAYLANDQTATAAGIDRLGKLLHAGTDTLVLPARSGPDLFSESLIRRAVDTGIPVSVVPVHRRYEVEHFTRLGVQGLITPDLGYLTGATPPLRADTWAAGGISAGEITIDPYEDRYALRWPETGVIGLDCDRRPAFVSLGQFGPVEAESYRLSFDVSFDPLPTQGWQHVSIAFGHADDRYYEHRSATADGYHAKLCADGTMGIYSHVTGTADGVELARLQPSGRLRVGQWTRLTLDVTPDLIRWARDDGTAVETRDSRFRGGYFHIGRSGPDGLLKLRHLTIS